ncbi:MAG: SulP family inorganic anion transporter [Longimicrobiales bacterium]|nr:SulP family inorganic anion transporter [Longimicrobiales bacterium]
MSGDAPGRLTRHDVVAGVSVALLLVPQSMAYAELAGLPAHVGLYAAALPPLAAALAASSPYLQTGPTAVTAVLTLGALLPLAPAGTPAYVSLAVLLALVVGIARVLVGLLRAGNVAYLMSQPVLMGFTSGAAVLILCSQVPGALGAADAPVRGVLERAGWALAHPGAWEAASVVLAALTVALTLGARRLHPLLPGVLLATAGGVVYSVATGYAGPMVGAVPRGLAPPALDLPWRMLPALVVPGVVIALVGFSEAASIARTFATEDRTRWNPHREFVGQGLANLAAAASGGFPVGGSFGRSSLNRLAGARTRWSGAVTGLVVLAFLPFAGVLAPLPRAVLSGIVIAAVASLVRLRPLFGLARASRPQALVGLATFIATLALSPRLDQAVLLGVVLALGVHAWREMRPRVRSWTEGDTLHIRPEGVLWFGSAPELEAEAFALLESDPRTTRIIFHLGALGRIDYTGALGLRQLREDADRAGIPVEFVDVPTHAERIVARVLGGAG